METKILIKQPPNLYITFPEIFPLYPERVVEIYLTKILEKIATPQTCICAKIALSRLASSG